MSQETEVRAGAEGDLPTIVAILNDAILHSDATLTSEPVTEAGRRDWFEGFAATGPYRLLVAQRDGRVVGYAASQSYRDHPAFRATVEVSIALDPGCRGQGVGSALYRVLLECLAAEPVHSVLAAVVLPNDASVALHRKFGFTEIGTFHEYAIKNGRYLSAVWLERQLP